MMLQMCCVWILIFAVMRRVLLEDEDTKQATCNKFRHTMSRFLDIAAHYEWLLSDRLCRRKYHHTFLSSKQAIANDCELFAQRVSESEGLKDTKRSQLS